MRTEHFLSSNKKSRVTFWSVKLSKHPLIPSMASVDESVVVVHSLFVDARVGCGIFCWVIVSCSGS